MAKRIAETLLNEDMILKDVDAKSLAAAIEPIITNELMVEDRINDEVRDFLRDHERSVDTASMDYRKLFDLTKQKIIKERGVII